MTATILRGDALRPPVGSLLYHVATARLFVVTGYVRCGGDGYYCGWCGGDWRRVPVRECVEVRREVGQDARGI